MKHNAARRLLALGEVQRKAGEPHPGARNLAACRRQRQAARTRTDLARAALDLERTTWAGQYFLLSRLCTSLEEVLQKSQRGRQHPTGETPRRPSREHCCSPAYRSRWQHTRSKRLKWLGAPVTRVCWPSPCKLSLHLPWRPKQSEAAAHLRY